MIAAVGFIAIVVAFVGSVGLVWRGWQVARNPDLGIGRLRLPVLVLLLGAVVAMAALEIGILRHDFTIDYVANHTSRSTPLVFLLASGWAALEGSIVLWGLVLAVFVALVARTVRNGDGLGAGALAVLGAISVFFFGLMATAANPFAICTEAAEIGCVSSQWLPFGSAVAPLDGPGPNPLLQNNLLMAVHPPMLYFGYVGFSVPFAFAISALARADRGKVWLERTHSWSLVAWSFLTLGILLGAWWSYEVLGWGGYWAWDPVENAAFLPWLVGTAFIHSAVVQRRRGMLQAWNLVLVISTFALTIFGTFLTRSGAILSVHAFSLSAVGPALLAFLGVIVIGSFALFALRSHVVASSPRLESLASREGVFLFNNLLLTVFAFTVLVGTLAPLLMEAFAGREVSVGRPFYDRATLPVAFALLLAMGIGPVTPYRVARWSVVWDRVKVPVVLGLGAGAAAVLIGVRSVPVVIVVGLSTFVISTLVRHYLVQVAAVRSRGEETGAVLVRLLRREPGYWGGQIAHIGFALLAVGIATSSGLAITQEVELAPGDRAVVDDYCVGYLGPFTRDEPNRRVEGAEIVLMTHDCSAEIGRMFPRVNRYPVFTQAVATPDVRWGFVEDVYLSLSGADGDVIFMDVFVFPFMWMIWLGGLITVVGGFFPVFVRKPARRTEVTTVVPPAGAP